MALDGVVVVVWNQDQDQDQDPGPCSGPERPHHYHNSDANQLLICRNAPRTDNDPVISLPAGQVPPLGRPPGGRWPQSGARVAMEIYGAVCFLSSAYIRAEPLRAGGATARGPFPRRWLRWAKNAMDEKSRPFLGGPLLLCAPTCGFGQPKE